METRKGKILVTFNPHDGESEETSHLNNIQKVFDIEQYLNDKVALKIFKDYGVLIRVHL